MCVVIMDMLASSSKWLEANRSVAESPQHVMSANTGVPCIPRSPIYRTANWVDIAARETRTQEVETATISYVNRDDAPVRRAAMPGALSGEHSRSNVTFYRRTVPFEYLPMCRAREIARFTRQPVEPTTVCINSPAVYLVNGRVCGCIGNVRIHSGDLTDLL
jgi:hypothetical protein